MSQGTLSSQTATEVDASAPDAFKSPSHHRRTSLAGDASRDPKQRRTARRLEVATLIRPVNVRMQVPERAGLQDELVFICDRAQLNEARRGELAQMVGALGGAISQNLVPRVGYVLAGTWEGIWGSFGVVKRKKRPAKLSRSVLQKVPSRMQHR